MNKTKINQEDDLLSQLIQKEDKQQEWNELVMPITKVCFRLNKAIEDSSYYQNMLDRLELLTENDEVDVYIDTVGGNLEGCIAICDAFQSSPAEVTGIITNKAYSAGAFIALCCDNIEVRPYARMMLHSFSGGFGGKDHEIDLDYNFNKNYIRNFLSSCCFGFLDEEELDEMFNGKDWWMDSKQIIERLQKRQEILEALQEESEDEVEELDEGCCGSCECTKDIPPPEYDHDDVAFKDSPCCGENR